MKRRSIKLFPLMVVLFSIQASGQTMHAAFDRVLKTFVVEGRVDYASLGKDRAILDEYLDRVSHVNEQEFTAWPRNDRLAYLINLYNAATLKLIVDHYPVTSIRDIGGFFRGPWNQPVVRLFGNAVTLNHLEHDIIRRQYNEPRIHMALVCAAKGCPPLRGEAYVAGKLEEQLDHQSNLFLSGPNGMRIDRDSGTVYLSPIFKWYEADFTSVTAFVEKHSGQIIDGLRVRWLDYDWTLNSSR
jgi:hypothetical protein